MSPFIKIIVVIGIGLVALPTLALGSSFVSSLIAGKTPSEAIQIIAEQMDSLLGRVDTLETSQAIIASSTAESLEIQKETARQVELLRAQNEALERQEALLREKAAALEAENEKVKTGLQESYDYTGAVNEDVAKLNEELHPPEVRKLHIVWNNCCMNYVIPGRATDIASWGVVNDGNVVVLVGSMFFSIKGIAPEWIESVSVASLKVIATDGLYAVNLAKKLQPGNAANFTISITLKSKYKDEPGAADKRIQAVLEGVDADGDLTTPLPLKGEEFKVDINY